MAQKRIIWTKMAHVSKLRFFFSKIRLGHFYTCNKLTSRKKLRNPMAGTFDAEITNRQTEDGDKFNKGPKC